MGDEKKDIMREYLSSLNIPPDIAEIYITLKLNGPQTLSALSRLTGFTKEPTDKPACRNWETEKIRIFIFTRKSYPKNRNR